MARPSDEADLAGGREFVAQHFTGLGCIRRTPVGRNHSETTEVAFGGRAQSPAGKPISTSEPKEEPRYSPASEGNSTTLGLPGSATQTLPSGSTARP